MPTARSSSVSRLVEKNTGQKVTTPSTNIPKSPIVRRRLQSSHSTPDLRTCKKESNNDAVTATDSKDSAKKKVKIKKKKKFVLMANLALTKYNLVKQVCSDNGFQITEQTNNDCMLIWSDSAVPVEKISELRPYQKINHFAGMGEICRKDTLARNMWRISRICPDDFDFVPNSWVLPGEFAMFQFYARESKKKRSKTYIRKPVNGAMGHGIWLTRNIEKIQANDTCIIQEYLDKPLLMDGYKFDLRMYVLVLSCDPLKIFLYKDGLVRMGTTAYVPPNEVNVSNSFMHLTNYSINKHSENFVQTSNTEMGSKRTLKYFWRWLQEKNGNVEDVWNSIKDVVIKKILVAMPLLFHAYHMCRGGDPKGTSCCFEVLGFDIFIDRKYKPWVLEVNRAPSFGTDQDLDYEIKYGVLNTTMKLLNIKAADRRKIVKAEKMESQKRLVGTGRKSVANTDVVTNKHKLLLKRKKELKWRLGQVRDEAKKKEYEEKNAGEFVRIYPPGSKTLNEYYNNLLASCTKVTTGRTSLQRENNPLLQLKEEELLDLLQEVENDVLHAVDEKGRLVPQGPTPLSSMPQSAPPRKRTQSTNPTDKISSRISSSSSRLSIRTTPSSSRKGERPKSPLTRSQSVPKIDNIYDDADRENKSKETLQLLNEMRIKFPGKSDEEARALLEQIQENWKLHRPRVAAYWLVKLDALKRRKVIDIVKGNVTVILQRIWKVTDVQKLILYRMFSKLFNRLLWSHGQGLWNCFNTTGDAWESIFLKSTERFIPIEMDCCRQVVKLCRECLLVVYQFAAESTISIPLLSSDSNFKTTTNNTLLTDHSASIPTTRRMYSSRSMMNTKHQPNSGYTMGSRIVRLYK